MDLVEVSPNAEPPVARIVDWGKYNYQKTKQAQKGRQKTLDMKQMRVGLKIGDHDLDINGPLLAPGYGAQGGTLDDLRRVFGPVVRHVLPSTSRELLATGPEGLAEAADRLNERLRELTA